MHKRKINFWFDHKEIYYDQNSKSWRIPTEPCRDRIPRIGMVLDYVRSNFDFILSFIPHSIKLYNLPYFYENMSTIQAIKLLIDQPSGSFLIRKSYDAELDTNKIFVSFNFYGRVGHIQDYAFNSKLLNVPLVVSHHHIYWNARKPYLKEQVSFAIEARIRQLQLAGALGADIVPHDIERNTFNFRFQMFRKNPFSLLTLCKSAVTDMISYDDIAKLKEKIPIKLILEIQNEFGMCRLERIRPLYLHNKGYDPDNESGDE